MSEPIKHDREVCRFFVRGTCRKGEECKWEHTKQQCSNEYCNTYTKYRVCRQCYRESLGDCVTGCGKKTTRSFCRDCWEVEKKAREEDRKIRQERADARRKAREEKEAHLPEYPCSNETCKNMTRRGDYCNKCHREAMAYVVRHCGNKDCSGRAMHGNRYCYGCLNRME